MKKLLFVAILGTLVACGETSTTTPATDSPVVAPVDSPAVVIVDSPAVVVVDSPVIKLDSPAVH